MRGPSISLQRLELLTSPDWRDYALIDSGGGKKLERYGSYALIRPEAQALWRPALPSDRWEAADGEFIPTGEESGGHWKFRKQVPSTWVLQYKKLRFQAQAVRSRHMGFFPEQANHWDWIGEQIRSASYPLKVLNLFGYTGLATLAAAEAGAHVTHVDASKKAITMARENQSLSGLEEAPIRWLVDDVYKFVRRDVRRGSQYDGLILDPPKFGRGPKGQVWEFFESLPNLLEECRALLSKRPAFVVLTSYAIRASAVSIHYALQDMLAGYGGEITSGELVLKEESRDRMLATSLFARWKA